MPDNDQTGFNFINDSSLEFDDISSEIWREYLFKNGDIVRINCPTKLNVSKSGGHRIFDAMGISHYVPFGWLHLRWKAKDGSPNFVK